MKGGLHVGEEGWGLGGEGCLRTRPLWCSWPKMLSQIWGSSALPGGAPGGGSVAESGPEALGPYAPLPLGGKSKSVELEDVKFHQCVRLSRFENDRTISFIPPDGEFELMSYRLNTHVSVPGSSPRSQLSALGSSAGAPWWRWVGGGSCLLPVVGTVPVQDESPVHEVTLSAGTGTLCLKTQTVGGARLLWHHCFFLGAPAVMVPALSQRPLASPYDRGLCALGLPRAAGTPPRAQQCVSSSHLGERSLAPGPASPL